MDPDDLYGLPLERFIAERTVLARDLRRSGRREEAEAVALLRKPSLAAWAVNQLVRTQHKAIEALFDAGDAAQRAQAELLSGRGGSDALREALADERGAVSDLVEVAGGLLTAEGHELSSATLDRVAESLHAAALEDQARAQVKDGCLERELRHVGIGTGPAMGAPAMGAPASTRRQPAHEADLKALRKAEADTRRAVDRANKALQAAQVRRDAAADSLKQADAAVAAAGQRAREAEAAHRQAKRELERASSKR
jgi:hypothetical protein